MGCIATQARRLGGTLEAEARRIGGNLGISTARKGGDLCVRASLICTVNLEKPYVRVEPEYIWLTESNLFTAIVGVESNRQWEAN